MKAEGLTPGQILQHSQRLMVPLFQRPYVWSKESQWEPLWDDIIRMAEALVVNFSAPPKPHFLGAVFRFNVELCRVTIAAFRSVWTIGDLLVSGSFA